MGVRDDGMYLADQVRRLCSDGPVGDVWKGTEIAALLDAASRYSGDHQRFYLAFLDGVRDLLDDEDEGAVLARFTRQASRSEARVLVDSETTRDHLTHVTQVFLVGWLVLNKCSLFRKPGEIWRPYGWDEEHRFELLNRAWLHTALLHDCAYSVQKAGEAREHEVRVRAMFGPAYEPANTGRVNREEATKAGKKLWQRRAAIIDRVSGPEVREAREKQCSLEDHGFMTGQALMAEAAQYPDATREVLEIAAASLACHNHRWTVDPEKKPSTEVSEWFSVDFWSEPLAALLTVSDEIQEWGRERVDMALAPKSRSGFVPAGVSLTKLDVNDVAGLSINARLLFRLFPEDRGHRIRQAAERETKNAQANRQYREAFKPRDPRHAAFNLRLRIEETVEDIPCAVARHFGWPIDVRARNSKARLPKRLTAWTPVTAHMTEGTAAGTKIAELTSSGGAKLRNQGERPLRAIVVEPGGAGKSTLLRALEGCERFGKTKLRALYIEELDDELFDLCEEARARRGDGEVLLVVDHLDRLVGTPKETYWLDQLVSLPREPWLHVVGACRPEDYQAVIAHSLGKGYLKASLDPKAGLLMEHPDEDGRATARGIERHLVGDPQALDELGKLALAMDVRRFLERPHGFETRVTFANEPAASWADGKIRFVHDAIQDYLAARYLARELAKREEPRGAQLRALLGLPRDVFRLLLDVLTSSRKLTSAERLEAARGLAAGLCREATLRHWLSDLARLKQAELVIPQFCNAYADDARVSPVAQMLLGILRYGGLKFTDLEIRSESRRSMRADELATREKAQATVREAVEALSRSLAELDAAWPSEDQGNAAEVLTVYLGDHLATVLARVATCDPEPRLAGQLAELATTELSRVKEPAGGVLSPGWVRQKLLAFDPKEPLQPLHKMYDRCAKPSSQRELFALRCYQLAGHIGGTYLLRSKLEADGLKDALCWHDRAVGHALRVLRTMDQPGRDLEQYGSAAHGLADAARHYSARIHFWIQGAHRDLRDHREVRFLLLEAAQDQEAAWAEARTALRPGERLPESHWLALGDIAFGRALTVADRNALMSHEEIEKLLEVQEEMVNEEYRRWSEKSARRDDRSIYSFMSERIGGDRNSPVAAAAQLIARLLR